MKESPTGRKRVQHHGINEPPIRGKVGNYRGSGGGELTWLLTKDYIFTTTNFITVEYLDSIHEEMQPDESLLICCKSFQEACESRYENITVRKIPNMLLGRCEFGKEDYSLNIADGPPVTGDDAFESTPVAETPARKVKKKSAPRGQSGLFDKEGEKDDE